MTLIYIVFMCRAYIQVIINVQDINLRGIVDGCLNILAL